MSQNSHHIARLIFLSRMVVVIFCLGLVICVAIAILQFQPRFLDFSKKNMEKEKESEYWQAPDTATISGETNSDQILYGRELIVKTSSFIGPLGSVSAKANGMNCQNCHLEAGTKPFGNNYGSVASLYPKFRARSGTIESIEKRVNDCIERSLNGEPIDSLSKEMRAIVAYMNWLGKNVPKGKMAAGSGLKALPWLDRAADPSAGKILYLQKCRVCHGTNGEGQKLSEKSHYIYPPLAGENSFTTHAGLYRISNFAKYIHANMPNGATHQKPTLTVEEAWDIAAYIITLHRPTKNITTDWPILETKPIDYPFGPFADSFSEKQHKFGPFVEIEKFYKSKNGN